jgi:hypothetical protein
MSSTAPLDRSAATRRGLSWAIAAYVAVWAFLSLATASTFGIGFAFGLSLVLVIPFLVAMRLWFRWSIVQKRELVYLSLLTFACGVTSLFLFARWLDMGFGSAHAADVQFDRLIWAASNDPAFRDVRFERIPFKSTWSTYYISGTVSSEVDLARLRSLADEYGFPLRRGGTTRHLTGNVTIGGGSENGPPSDSKGPGQ